MSIALQAPPGFFLAKEKDLKGLYKRRKELEQAFAKGKATEQRADALVMAYYVLQHMAELALKVYSSLGKESPSFAPARAYVVSVLDILEKEKGMAEKLEPDDDAVGLVVLRIRLRLQASTLSRASCVGTSLEASPSCASSV